MPWKLDEDGTHVTAEVDGAAHPVWVKADGSEEPFDPERSLSTISRLTSENQGRRKKAETLEGELETWKALGVEPGEATELLERARNLDDGELIKAGEVDRLKAQISQGYEKKLAMAQQERDAALLRITELAVGSRFSSSEWFTGEKPKLVLPPQIGQSYFGKYFRPDDDNQVRGYFDPGKWEQQIINDRGEPATFDEAIGQLLDSREFKDIKDRILSPSGTSGSGAPSNGHRGGSAGGEDLKGMPAAARLERGFAQSAAS